MKILMIAPTPFFADRGCHVRILGEIRALQSRGHEVRLCTYPLGRDVPGIAAVRTWPVPWYHKLSAGPSWHKYYIDVLLFATAARQIRQWRPNVIHAHLHEGATIAILARWGCRTPLLLDYQGSLTSEVTDHGFTRQGSLHHRLLQSVERWVERRANAIVTSTSQSAERLRSAGHLAHERVSVLGDGIDIGQFRPDVDGTSTRAACGIPDDVPVIVYVGLLTSYQGADLLLEALAGLRRRRRFHALVIGYPDEQAFRRKAETMGLDGAVTFTGRIPFEELPAYLAVADVAVSPKRQSTEGNGKLFAYMAAGLPVVAFDTPVSREILGDAGVLVEAVDAESLAEALAQLLRDESRRAALGRDARMRAEAEFSWGRQGDLLEQRYRELLGIGDA